MPLAKLPSVAQTEIVKQSLEQAQNAYKGIVSVDNKPVAGLTPNVFASLVSMHAATTVRVKQARLVAPANPNRIVSNSLALEPNATAASVKKGRDVAATTHV